MGKLLANAPPPRGRSNRKLGEHHDDIVKLRAKGYLLRDIQDALIEVVGIKVGVSTIQRELAKARGAPPARPKQRRAGRQQAVEPGKAPGVPPRPPAPPTATTSGSGTPQERADAFMASIVTNPLLKGTKT